MTVCLSPRFMPRALINLVRNAATHAFGRVDISIDKRNHDCLIHVDDDGPGIPEADRGRVF